MGAFRPIYWSRRLRRAGGEARRRLRANEMVRGATPTAPPSSGPDDDEPYIWFAANRPALFWFLATMDIQFVTLTAVAVVLLVLLG